MEEIYSIPGCIFEHAKLYVDTRVMANRDHYKKLYWKSRSYKYMHPILFDDPVDNEFYTDFKGILGELLVRHHFDLKGVNYTTSAFVKEKGVSDPDLIVDGKKIDVKGCERSLKVNMFTIDKLDVDFVMFVLFLSDQRYLLLDFTKDKIKEWNVVTINDRNKYYEFKIDKRQYRYVTPDEPKTIDNDEKL
mgnify:FL=1|jgi:hypothetical protein|tara:strand:+ start:1041 stop:1610 length:570 start_codon:yes stop_codon:yes gene_type:complete